MYLKMKNSALFYLQINFFFLLYSIEASTKSLILSNLSQEKCKKCKKPLKFFSIDRATNVRSSDASFFSGSITVFSIVCPCDLCIVKANESLKGYCTRFVP